MTDSSEEASNLLDGIDVRSIYRLLTVVAQASDPLFQRVERSYAEYAPNFDTALRFAKAIGWIADRDSRLVLTDAGLNAWRDSTEDSVRDSMLDAVTHRSSPCSALVATYLSRYSLSGTEVTYRPSVAERLRDANVRNVLMDLKVIEHRGSDDCYVLMPGREDVFAWAISTGRNLSNAQISRLRDNQQALGQSAELAALSFERERLGDKWWPHIEHVSAEAPYSPYDIKSVTIAKGRSYPRFIEVKAVPGDTYRFFWSRAELELAELLTDRYFLYLVPTTSGTFDMGKMLILQDPYRTLYQNEAEWATEENVVVCSKR